MRDLTLRTPQVGQKVSRGYLLQMERMAAHSHVPGKGLDSLVTGTASAATAAASGGTIIFGMLDEDLDSGSSAEMSVWNGDPLADSTNTETIYDWSFIPSGQKLTTSCRVTATKEAGKYYLLTAGDCPENQ